MMKIKLLLLFGLISITNSFAISEDVCTADVSQYTKENLKHRKNIFKTKSSNVAKVLPSQLLDYAFQDQILLKNKVTVTYTVGGCAHYNISFKFQGTQLKKANASKKLSRAEALLKSLVLNDNKEKSLFLKALAEAKKKKLTPAQAGEYQLPCGDALCTLTDRDNFEVLLSYSFAL